MKGCDATQRNAWGSTSNSTAARGSGTRERCSLAILCISLLSRKIGWRCVQTASAVCFWYTASELETPSTRVLEIFLISSWTICSTVGLNRSAMMVGSTGSGALFRASSASRNPALILSISSVFRRMTSLRTMSFCSSCNPIHVSKQSNGNYTNERKPPQCECLDSDAPSAPALSPLQGVDASP